MIEMVNYGIDLGTTNSLIAKFDVGHVDVFKNPRGHKEGLPSVVAFRKDKIFVGDKARDYMQKDPKNVLSRFKRKMGTTETSRVECIDVSKTPAELSALILKELKGFVHSGENVKSAVITIPASFDTIQSNASKEAGTLAGINEVILLQEPIAASLAYANRDNSDDLKNSQWIVYDLGGGTFDVALVKIVEGELTVIDHEGDNYFGGTDFDAMIVEELIVPELESIGKFQDLIGEMKSATGQYEKEWYRLLLAAEEAKIELSSDKSTDIDFEMEDDNGDEVELNLTITRSQFEEVIKDSIDTTTSMLKNILTRQSLQPKDLQFLLMVGGSTFIPFVRKYVEEVMNITVKTDIDPTNAIVVGAAYFAGVKQQQKDTKKKQEYMIKVRTFYERSTQENEEMFTAKIEGGVEGMTYRIHSLDGSFDSNTKQLSNRIIEDLPLRSGEFNLFEFSIMDAKGNVIPHGNEQIQIAQGRYSVAGQMLPDELSLVRDIVGENDTRLDRLFEKNAILPTRGKKTVEVGRTIVKGATGPDDRVKLIVVEGPSTAHFMANKPIGSLEISGEMINRDLLRGTEIDMTFEISESRDLSVSAYLNGTGQEFSQVFNPNKRDVVVADLGRQIVQLEATVQTEQEEAIENKNNEVARELGGVLDQVQALLLEAGNMPKDSITDEKFQLEDKKRALAAEVYQLTATKRADSARSTYLEMKGNTTELVQEHGNDSERHRLREVVGREEVFLHSNNADIIEAATDELGSLRYQILMRTPGYLVHVFEHLMENRISMNDQDQAKILIDNGKNLISNESWEDLRIVISRLWDLMPDTERDTPDSLMFTGIV
ncbi:MAG: Hsp70 family protein [Candidatus Marinimicrobia bacterium]|jgi:molecular chaperone DnaK|nr:Hsp70 family protein [Candidatus Neomarinimicrobiota bacterium]MBT4994117.1 Hsp70 family protein [Candidatus Neomarinimicrobiota bacterium]